LHPSSRPEPFMGWQTWHAGQVDQHAPVSTAHSSTTERHASGTPRILSYSIAHGKAYNGGKRRSRNGGKAWDSNAKTPTHGAPPLEAKEACHGNGGFDFLGFTLRPYPVGTSVSRKHYVPIIKPSKKSMERPSAALAALRERRRAATLDEGLSTLSPTIIGWCNAVTTPGSKKAFQRFDALLWHKMYQGAQRKHNTTTAAWILATSCQPAGTRKHPKIMGTTPLLRGQDNPRRERQIPRRVAASPYDGHGSYWGTRKGHDIGGGYHPRKPPEASRRTMRVLPALLHRGGQARKPS
jgi:hypothetical protein